MGAYGELKTDAEGLAKVAGWKSHVEATAGTTFDAFEVIHYKTQIVAGTNWEAKVKIGDDEYAHVVIHEKLPHTGEEPSCSSFNGGKTLDDPLGS
uniref:Cystatin n=1 Tax=Euplotes vannus TaxID=5939 RepID=Q6A1N7_EUPVA|nr:cystatin [Euplotes vannus]